MIFKLEDKDLRCGMLLGSFSHNEQYVLGYRYRNGGCRQQEPVLVSLADGLVRRFEEGYTVADHLNAMGLVPQGMIDEIRKVWDQGSGETPRIYLGKVGRDVC